MSVTWGQMQAMALQSISEPFANEASITNELYQMISKLLGQLVTNGSNKQVRPLTISQDGKGTIQYYPTSSLQQIYP